MDQVTTAAAADHRLCYMLAGGAVSYDMGNTDTWSHNPVEILC